MNKIIRISKDKQYLFLLLYRIFLDIVYKEQICRYFGYSGFKFKFNLGLLFISWLLLFLAFPIIKKCVSDDCFSSVIMLFLVYLSYIPFTTMIAFQNFDISYVISNVLYWMVVFIFFLFSPKATNYITLKTNRNDEILFIIEIFFILLVIYISYKFTGFRFTISLSNVYQYRSEMAQASLPTLLRYFYSSSKTILPILLLYSLKKNDILNVFFIVIIQILNFSINGAKTVLFSTFLAIILYYIYNSFYLRLVPFFLTILCILSLLETILFRTINIMSYVIRRVLFLPNLISSYYFDFFTKNEPDFFRQGFLRFFGIKSPYDEIDHLIGEVYFGNKAMGANNGLISDAITNFGIIGIIIMPILLIIILRLIDKCAYGIDKKLYIVLSVLYAFMIISSFITTILLTHGLLFMAIILLLIPRNNKKEERKKHIRFCK